MGTSGIDSIIAKVNKEQGEGTIIRGSDINSVLIPRCTSGCLSLDVALGGGWPMNQFSEVVGDESSGKTAMLLKTIAANQARDKNWIAAWFDAEGSYDPDWSARLGVDNSRMLVMTDNGMESVYQTSIEFLDSREVDAVIIDSIPALVPDQEDEALIEELQVGLQARLTNKYFRKNRPAVRRSMTTAERPVLAVIINQWREKIGVMYGDPRTTPGGKGKNFACSVRLEVRRDDWIEVQTRRVGQVMKFRTFKNKTAPPHRTATVDFFFDDTDELPAGSYDYVKDVINVAMLEDIIHQGGAYYWYGDNVDPKDKWKGRAAAVAAIRDDEALRQQVEADVLAKYGLVKPSPRKRRPVRRS